MAIKPILFNTEMVRAILDGRKTCTRRILKGAIPFDEKAEYWNVLKKGEWSGPICVEYFMKQGSPYKPGDILYVRESVFQGVGRYLDVSGETVCVLTNDFEYYADGLHEKDHWKDKYENTWMHRRPSIHMPKEAARIWLKVTDVRVERLQSITEGGAKAEGAIDNRGFIHSPENEYDRIHTAREHFIKIWNNTIKKFDIDRYGWDANPYVWVISFERCEKPKEGER
jgi:hypothetical protein